MSANIKIEDIVEKTEVTSAPVEVPVEQDPLKTELEKVQQKEGRTEEEKAAFSFKKIAARLTELGSDPAKILGIKVEPKEETTTEENEDDKPVTLGMLKKMQQKDSQKSALQQAEEIQNETERELVKHHLENTIKPSGNPTEDLRLARSLVNSFRNTQILEEAKRRPPVKSFSNSSGVDAKKEEEVVFTPDEQTMMKAPFFMSPQEVMDARAGKKFKFKN